MSVKATTDLAWLSTEEAEVKAEAVSHPTLPCRPPIPSCVRPDSTKLECRAGADEA